MSNRTWISERLQACQFLMCDCHFHWGPVWPHCEPPPSPPPCKHGCRHTRSTPKGPPEATHVRVTFNRPHLQIPPGCACTSESPCPRSSESTGGCVSDGRMRVNNTKLSLCLLDGNVCLLWWSASFRGQGLCVCAYACCIWFPRSIHHVFPRSAHAILVTAGFSEPALCPYYICSGPIDVLQAIIFQFESSGALFL